MIFRSKNIKNHEKTIDSCQVSAFGHKTPKKTIDCRMDRVARQRNFDKLPILNLKY